MGSAKGQSTAASTLSRAQFVRAADRACAREYKADKAIPKPTNVTSLVNGLQRALPLFEHEILSLRQLEPPDQDAAAFAKVLNALDAEDLAATHLVDALEAGQARRSKMLGRQIDALNRRLRSLDKKLGLPACVKNA